MFDGGTGEAFTKAFSEMASLHLKSLIESGIGRAASEIARIQAETLKSYGLDKIAVGIANIHAGALKSAGIGRMATEMAKLVSDQGLLFRPSPEDLEKLTSLSCSQQLLNIVRQPPEMVDLSFLDEEGGADDEGGHRITGFGEASVGEAS